MTNYPTGAGGLGISLQLVHLGSSCTTKYERILTKTERVSHV